MKLSDEIVIRGNRAMARSFAKINLTLDITGKRDDGYHNIKTIMQSVNLTDAVIVDKVREEIKVTTNKKFLPTNNKNIAYKAAELFFEETGIAGGAKIFIHKNIPVAAGLAGGSGNGAAVLASLNILYDKPLSDEDLLKISAKLGADVAYCLTMGTQLAEGIGEILTPIKPLQKQYILMVTPPIGISTPWVYEQFDNSPKEISPDTDAMISAIENNDYEKICASLSNTFETVVMKEHPVIGGIKQKLLLNGANGAVMSGSGSTVFGFFDEYKKAKASHDSFSLMYKDVFLTTTL